MKIKKVVNATLIVLFSFLTLFCSTFIIYFYGFKKFQPTINPQIETKQPRFSQEETNWLVNDQGIILDRFKKLFAQKTKLKVLKYEVNNPKKILKIKVTVTKDKKNLQWFYQLEY